MKDHSRATRLGKQKQDKEAIALWRKKIRLMNSKRNMNKVELEKPIRWGYKKFFVLREDVAKGPDAKVYLGVLPYIQNTIYCKRKDFTKKSYKTKKMVEMEHSLNDISHKKFNEISETLTLKQRSLFVKYWYTTKYHSKTIGGEWRYRLMKDWMFVPKIDVHYVTHQLILDPLLESELAEIENRIYRDGIWNKIVKHAFGGSYYDRDDLRKKLIDKYYSDQTHMFLGFGDDENLET